MQIRSIRTANTGEEAEHQILHRIYLYYLFGFVLSGPIGPTIGFLHALKQRQHMATAFGKSHIVYQIQIFRRGAVSLVAGLSVTVMSIRYIEGRNMESFFAHMPTIGLGVIFISAVWFLAKCVIGMSNSNAGLGA